MKENVSGCFFLNTVYRWKPVGDHLFLDDSRESRLSSGNKKA